MIKNMSADAPDMDLTSGSGRSPGEGIRNTLQNSCLGNAMERGVWKAPWEPWDHKSVRHNLVTKQQQASISNSDS